MYAFARTHAYTGAQVIFAIDPLLAALAHFDTSEDLTERIRLLFRVLDVDESGSLSFDELALGCSKLRVKPQIRLSPHDWETMTAGIFSEPSQQELDLPQFDEMMRHQLKLYVQRQLANAMEVAGNDSPDRPGTTFFVLKLLLIGMDQLLSRQKLQAESGALGEEPLKTRTRSLVRGSASGPSGDEGGGAGRGGGINGDARLVVTPAVLAERLNKLEHKMGEMSEGISFLVARQREADIKDKDASVNTSLATVSLQDFQKGPANFLRQTTERMIGTGRKSSDTAAPSETVGAPGGALGDYLRHQTNPSTGGRADGSPSRQTKNMNTGRSASRSARSKADRSARRSVSPHTERPTSIDISARPMSPSFVNAELPHYEEFTSLSESARVRNRATVVSDQSRREDAQLKGTSEGSTSQPLGGLMGLGGMVPDMNLPDFANLGSMFSPNAAQTHNQKRQTP